MDLAAKSTDMEPQVLSETLMRSYLLWFGACSSPHLLLEENAVRSTIIIGPNGQMFQPGYIRVFSLESKCSVSAFDWLNWYTSPSRARAPRYRIFSAAAAHAAVIRQTSHQTWSFLSEYKLGFTIVGLVCSIVLPLYAWVFRNSPTFTVHHFTLQAALLFNYDTALTEGISYDNKRVSCVQTSCIAATSVVAPIRRFQNSSQLLCYCSAKLARLQYHITHPDLQDYGSTHQKFNRLHGDMADQPMQNFPSTPIYRPKNCLIPKANRIFRISKRISPSSYVLTSYSLNFQPRRLHHPDCAVRARQAPLSASAASVRICVTTQIPLIVFSNLLWKLYSPMRGGATKQMMRERGAARRWSFLCRGWR